MLKNQMKVLFIAQIILLVANATQAGFENFSALRTIAIVANIISLIVFTRYFITKKRGDIHAKGSNHSNTKV